MSLKTRPVCLPFSLITFLLLFLQPARAQTDFGDVDAILQRNQKALGNNLVAVIAKEGKVVYQKQLGQDFTGKTQVPIGTCSQWFTTTITMMLVEEGKISLDDPVVKYIPTLAKYMKNYITIRHCLSHISGLENVKNVGKFQQYKKTFELQEVINEYAAKEIANNPGVEFNFGIIGPALVGRVLEIVTKKNFDRLVAERLFRPLKMRATTFTDEAGYAPNPGSGARSSANDFIIFLMMLQNKGEWEGKKYLSEKSIAEMQKPHLTDLPVKFKPKAAEGWDYGLGVWIQEEDANGNPTVISNPSFTGAYAYIDKCRNYTALLFVQKNEAEQKKELMLQFKETIEGLMPSTCK